VVYTAPGFKFYDVAVLPVTPPIPEPASATLLVIGAAIVASLTRRAVAG
jgi:PEP-CTERM motif